MKVAFLYPYMVAGGAERVTLLTARLFSEMGIETLFYSFTVKDTIFVPGDVRGRVRALPESKDVYTSANVRYLVEEIEREEIKILFLIDWSKRIPEALRSLPGVALVAWEHSMPMYRHILKRTRAELRGDRSWLKWLEWQTIGKFKYVYTDTARRGNLMDYRRTIGAVDRYIVLCQEYADELSALLGLSLEERKRLVPMPNTIDLPADPSPTKLKRIIYMGRLTYIDKRVDRLLEVWRRVVSELPEWELVIYGDGEERDALEGIIAGHSLTRVRMEGYQADPTEAYREAAVLCMTSTFEGYPMSMIEAQSYGVVPVAFDCCSGIRSVIGADERAGLLVPAFDLDAYGRRLVELCQDEDLRARLQAGALAKSQDYAHATNTPRWKAFFEGLGLSLEQ